MLMSTYNGGKYLKTQIDSILAQKDVSVTLLVRDDGSSDGTLNILNDYRSRGLLKWYTGENLRSAYSFWDLLERAPEAEFYAFADQDDYWYPDKLSAGVAMLETAKAGVPALYFCKKRLVDSEANPLAQEDEFVRGATLGFSLLGCRASGCTMVLNQALLEQLRRCRPDVMTMHDSWVLRVAGAVGSVFYDETPHMDYRQHSGNVVGASASRREIWRRRLQTLSARRKDRVRTQMAKQLYAVYHEQMSPHDREYVKYFASVRESFPARVKLLFSDYLQTYERSELPFAKLVILLGWV